MRPKPLMATRVGMEALRLSKVVLRPYGHRARLPSAVTAHWLRGKSARSGSRRQLSLTTAYERLSERDRQREDRRRDHDDREQHRDEGRVLDHSWEPVFVV